MIFMFIRVKEMTGFQIRRIFSTERRYTGFQSVPAERFRKRNISDI
jgi:hypothetical protein